MKWLIFGRKVIALFFFVLLLLAFIGIPALIPSNKFIYVITNFQFVPSIISYLNNTKELLILIALIILLFHIGRFYCSSVCPLGTLQDIISKIGISIRKKNKYHYKKPNNILRYSFFILVILSLIFGIANFLIWLDPYSNFGKIVSNLFRPIAIVINNSILNVAEKAGIDFIIPINYHNITYSGLIFSSILLIVLIIMAAFRGRLFCNTICPVGTFFSILSRFSIYKIQIVKSVCSMCGRCSSVCKSECIDIKNQKIDFDRCVVCLNCINTCPEKGIKFVSMVKLAKLKYQSKKERKFDSSKRTFITGIIGTLIGANIVGKLKAYDQKKDKKQNLIPIVKNKPVTPPGSLSLEHYKTSCTACHLCVSICPTHVLSPSFLEYGLTGMLIPYMNYDKSFCNYECNKCSQVCPTGAIIPITSNQKKIIQIGKVVFIRENCIVYNEETSCGACAEHCPTSAVHMVPYRGFLTIPETNQEICIGCGACEYACPAQPHKAIYVEANKVHEEAKLPDEGKPQEGTPKYFPF